MHLDSFSYGGGIQSNACLVLATQGFIECKLFIFANVGDDSEHPDTLAYIRDVAAPYAAQNGIELCTVSARDTIYQNIMKQNRRIIIPAHLSNGAPGNRTCTTDYKIRVISREIKRRGATKANPWTVGLGISTDEFYRARNYSGYDYYTTAHPLLDLRLSRANCVGVIERAGLPVPPKSACWFCPFQSDRRWHELRKTRPDLFDKACQMEKRINEKREAIGRDVMHLHKFNIALVDAVPEQDAEQLDLFADTCDSGFCFV